MSTNQIIGPINGSVRSIVTLMIASAVVVMTYQGKLTAEQFLPMATLVFTFYFLKDKLGTPTVVSPTVEPAATLVGEENTNA